MVELIRYFFSDRTRGCLSVIIILIIISIPYGIVQSIIDNRDRQTYAELLTKCETACDNNDYEKAYEILANMREVSRNDKKSYSDTKRKVFEREMNYLISLNSSEASNRIAYLLTENLQLASKPMPEGTYDETYDGSLLESLKNYNNKNSSSNEICNKFFNLAASQGNKYLCRKLLFFYREEAVYQKVDNDNSNDSQNKTKETYIVSYKNIAKEAAIEKYKEFFGEEPDLSQTGDVTE